MNIGKYKVIFDRARSYAQSINVFILVYLLIDKTGWLWWYSLIIIVGLIIVYFDNKHVIGQERDYIWTRPGELKNMIENIKYIKSKV